MPLEPAETRPTVSVKIVGMFLCVLLPSMLVYTICRLNRNKQHWEGKGKQGKGKKGLGISRESRRHITELYRAAKTSA